MADELYVNEATLEALRNEIEADVKRTLQKTVLLPLLAAGVVVILLGGLWYVPQQVTSLVREDPQVNQRFRAQVADYLGDEEGGGRVIREQVIELVRGEKSLKQTVEDVANSAVSRINIEDLIKNKVEFALDDKKLNEALANFFQDAQGKRDLKSAVATYFSSPDGTKQVTNATSIQLKSSEFREVLFREIEKAVSN
ncbi:MAG: hypothetical protein QNJ67_20045 [Kiloniellales bacterium]|nr:hypothetical protein [Kiloniellales bacterium]